MIVTAPNSDAALSPGPILQLEGIAKAFNNHQVLKDIAFNLTRGEIIALLGPSGCGKSTLLQIIAGLEKPDQGTILWQGSSILETPPHLRGFGLMFQDYALFPHMDVGENIAFGLRMVGMQAQEIHSRVAQVLALVGLENFSNRDVASLSGGEQQRVALARSLAPQPQLLMLDEPLGSVDRTLRERLLADLRRILRKMQQTAIYVTHDQEEAFAIADRIVLIQQGSIEQIGTPQAIYHQPHSAFVARFLGMTNLLSGTITFDGAKNRLRMPIGEVSWPETQAGEVTVLIRPDAATLELNGDLVMTGMVMEKTFRGNLCQLRVMLNGSLLTFDFLSSTQLPAPGEPIQFSIQTREGIIVFPSDNS